ncbi:MAG: peptide chain release factor 1 [Oscillospiraceae bacterium]|nr:peptide chain release factor 1 [Oscillospiraceae bacterium]
MLEKLEEIERRFCEIGEALGEPDAYTDPARMTALLREQKELAPLAEAFRAYRRVLEQEDEARAMQEDEDSEVRALAYEECGALAERREKLLEEMKKLLLPKDPDDRKNAILEIRGGVGGEEAALFAAALWRMYSMYAERKRWKAEILSASETELGGFKELQVQISGEGAFSRLKYESGAHRVQRVPDTEAQGRIHTSAATVAVLPEAEEVDIEIDPDDLDIVTCRSGGAGGQHVNKTESAIRIVHKPTGIVVECQDERSQHKNKDKAMKVLRAKLYEKKRRELDEARGSERRSQVGSGDRSERVRTYNFPQGRVTDHRVNLTLYKLTAVMDGDLDELIDTLAAAGQAAQLAGQGT